MILTLRRALRAPVSKGEADRSVGGRTTLPIARDAAFVLSRLEYRARHQGSGMHINPAEGHPSMDYAEHQRTYKLFLKMAGYLITGVVALLALLAIFVV
jgi:hypothetical protein